MNIFTQIFVVLIVLTFLLYVISKLRKEQIEFKYALVWLISGMIIVILAIFPQILAWTGSMMGVGLPLNLVFFLGIILNMIISFALTVTYSDLKNMVYKVTQLTAILDNELNKEKTYQGNEKKVATKSNLKS